MSDLRLALEACRDYREQLDRAIKERDEARECLRETIEVLTVKASGGVYSPSYETVQRWRKAAGLEETK